MTPPAGHLGDGAGQQVLSEAAGQVKVSGSGDPEAIVRRADAVLDFTRPVALMLLGIMGLIQDDDQARRIVNRLTQHLPPGSYLALYDGSDTDPAYVDAIHRYNAAGTAVPYTPRSPERITRFFDGLTLLPPGVVSVTRWRPNLGPAGETPRIACHGGLAVKP